MATKAQLISSLENLISKADEQEQIFQSSRAKLYLLLGETYAWWRDASRFEGFLESLYEQHNIKKRGKEEKFTQILRLIWKKEWNGKDGATLQTWSNGLQAVHKVVESNPSAYKESMAIKISQYLHTVGGLRGAVGDTRKEVNFFDETVSKNRRRNSKLDIESALNIKKKHLELGKQYFTNTNRYLINIVNNKSAIAASNEGYAVALVKQDKRFQNKFKILSVTADTTLINEAIVKTYRRNSESTPYTLRLLGEIIKTQSLPIALENHRDHLLDKSKVKNKDGIAMKQMKRIVIRSKSKDILLSESRTDCSVVTIVKPKNQIINSSDDLVLRINDHRYIEQEIIQTDDMSFNTSLSESLKRVLDKDIKASYKLEIKNIVTNKIRNIYFYKLNEIHEGTRQQADIDEHKVGKYVWTASANREWLESLNNVFTDRWLNALGNQINRKHYKQFRLNLGKKEFSISYDGVRNNFDQIEKQIKLPSVTNNSKAIEIILMSKDVLTVFNALSTNEDIQNVKIYANENVISFKYSTQLGQYEIFIPTCKIQNKLITNAFKGYQ